MRNKTAIHVSPFNSKPNKHYFQLKSEEKYGKNNNLSNSLFSISLTIGLYNLNQSPYSRAQSIEIT